VGCKRCSSSASSVGGACGRCRCAVACFSLCVFWRSSVLRFELVFFNQESLLFGCCGPWARGNITTANRQYAGPTVGGSKPGSELESRHRASSYSRFVEVLQVPSQVGDLGSAAAPVPLINIEALCAAPPEASAHSPSQMPLSCPVAPPSQREMHKDRAAAVVAWRGGRAPPGPRSPSPAPRPVARPPQRPAPRRSRVRPSCVT